MSTQTQSRQMSLRLHLTPEQAGTRVSARWIRSRVVAYQSAAGLPLLRAFTDRDAYAAAKGEPLADHHVGEAHIGLPGQRLAVPLIFLDPFYAGANRAAAEALIAHEVTHARWTSLGHSERFFARTQDLLDEVARREDRLATVPGSTLAHTLLRAS